MSSSQSNAETEGGQDGRCKQIQHCKDCCDLSALQERISQAESALAAMKEEEHQLKSKINATHDPLQALPPEILSYIFEGVRQHNPYTKSLPFPSIRPFLTLGCVCRYWRQFAWATPSLWNELDFFLNPEETPENYTFATRIGILKDCLLRSGDLPLRLYIYWNEDNGFELEPADLEPLMETLEDPRVTARMADVLFHLPEWCFVRLSCLSAPLLKELIIETIDGEQETISPWTIINLGEFASNLELLASNNVDLDRFIFSYEKLIHVEIQNVSPLSCIEILREAKSLRTCTIEMLDSPFPSTFTTTPAVQDQLVNMQVWYDGPSSPGSIFELFTFRVLESLRIVSDSDQPIKAQPLLSLFARSQCPLKALYLSGTSTIWSLVDLESLIILLPTLSCLHLSKMPDGPPISKIFRTVFRVVPPTSPTAQNSARAIITEFNCTIPWTAADSADNWAFIPEVFSRLQSNPSAQQESPKAIHLELQIPSTKETRRFWIPPSVTGVIRDLESRGWKFALKGQKGEHKIKDLVARSIMRHHKKRLQQIDLLTVGS